MRKNVVRAWLAATCVACAVHGAGAAALYYVIDLSDGPNAASYPIEMLENEPSSGWTSEYKTTKLVLRRIEAGSFIMGEDQKDASHRVTLTKPFTVMRGDRPHDFT